MTLEQKFDLCIKAIEAEKQGNEEESDRIMREEVPLPSYMAEWVKKYLGAAFLIKHHYNLEEADAEFGSGWLDR